jgi:hypothetical protein
VQARAIYGEPLPEWIVGDSRNILASCDKNADVIFSCPSYADGDGCRSECRNRADANVPGLFLDHWLAA